MKSSKSLNLDKYYLTGFFLVFTAGILWSFGAVVVRYMTDAGSYQPQYLFYRGFAIATILCTYLLIREGFSFYKNFKRVGWSGVVGGFCLAMAFTGFIFSITMTTAAVTLFMLAAMPFIAAIVGYIILKEKLRKITFVAMIIAFVGVMVMIINDSIGGSPIGAIVGFGSALGFALYTVTIRWRPDTPKFTTVVLAGLFCSTFSLIIIFSTEKSFLMPAENVYLSLLHGSLVASGLILYSLGAKYMPAAELALLSLMEVVGGVLWVWMPLFGINEVPNFTTIIGGFIVILAVFIHGVGARKKTMPPTT
ncbi:MAG: hypothetical protein CFH21_00541 [Alphaproteobacteria bacterium MarineAlpha5_Bin11]|nr:EamA family transporter [Pelagibacteraceae bacterium]PPR44047.1 MAG: hypothetical protein CFH21_00541 [Alphaproteobacteria bacterium MarineAlpha5_Bin11]PPR51988.1 MAG: hypothetical protein CFH20_00176 [Alphaproteobacteria bacterium MarineAlpha5_Bin10]|tara:strand:+ start:3365 stop:4285 length:921 start_codon:yes stop_codon:yes gene_type:complete